MRRIKFNGFTSASAVTIAAAQASGANASASTGPGGWGVPAGGADPEFPPPGGSASAEIVIRRRNPARFAPDGIFFEVTNLQGFDTPATHAPTNNIYEPQFHDIEVFWNFGDPGSVYSAPVHTLPEHKNRNIAKGHQAAHVYRTPGTYTVTAFLVEMSSGKTASATLTLSGADAVLDPDAVFAGNKTIFIDQTESYAGAPAGALTFPSFAAVTAAYGTQHSATNPSWGYEMRFPGGDTRIMLASGYDEVWENGIFCGWYGSAPSGRTPSVFLCAAPEASVKPTVRPTSGDHSRYLFYARSNFDLPTQFVIAQGVDVVGTWDPLTESDIGQNQYLWTGQLPDVQGYFLADALGLHKLTTGINMSGGFSAAMAHIVHDCDIREWGNFGVYVDGPKYDAILGNSMAQNPDALSGGPKFSPQRHNNHGPIRCPRSQNVIIDGNDMFTIGGWSAAGSGRFYTQPCIRANTAGTSGPKYNITRNVLEGGQANIFVVASSEGERVNAINNLVADANVMISGNMTDSNIRDDFSGSTYRNNLIIRPDYSALRLSVAAFKFEPLMDSGGLLARSAPLKIYQNTIVNLLSPENDKGDIKTGEYPVYVYGTDESEGGFDAVLSIENNIVHSPNSTVPITTYAPIDSTSLFEARDKGYKERWQFYEYALSAAIAAGGSVVVPFPSGMTADDFADEDSWCWLTGSIVYRNGANGVAVDVVPTGVRLTNNTGAALGPIVRRITTHGHNFQVGEVITTTTGETATVGAVDGTTLYVGSVTGGSGSIRQGATITGSLGGAGSTRIYLTDKADAATFSVGDFVSNGSATATITALNSDQKWIAVSGTSAGTPTFAPGQTITGGGSGEIDDVNVDNAAVLNLVLDRYGPDGAITDGSTPPLVPPGSIWSGQPLTGSLALGAALTGLTSYSDIRMKPRPIYPSVGAWEL